MPISRIFLEVLPHDVQNLSKFGSSRHAVALLHRGVICVNDANYVPAGYAPAGAIHLFGGVESSALLDWIAYSWPDDVSPFELTLLGGGGKR